MNRALFDAQLEFGASITKYKKNRLNDRRGEQQPGLPSLGRARRCLGGAGSGALNPRRPDDLEAAVRVGASDGMTFIHKYKYNHFFKF